MLELVRRRVIEHLPPEEGGVGAMDRIVSLDAARGVLDGYCFIVFDRAGEPSLVAKAARTVAGIAVFRTEYETLTALDERGMNRRGDAVPRPLGIWDEDETLITLQTALRGRLLKNEPGRAFFSRRSLDGTFASVRAWCDRFHETCAGPPVEITAEIHTREVEVPVERFLERFRNPPRDRDFLHRRLLGERVLEGARMPLAPRHGDFCTANMIMQRHGLGVFDWEFSLAPRLPLFDLFFFLSSTRFPFGGLRGESRHFESFAAVYWGDSHFATAARRVIFESAERYGIPQETLADLFLVALVHVANMKYEAMVEACGGDPAEPLPWAELPRADKDVPFACIRDGVFHNLGHAAVHGLPGFS